MLHPHAPAWMARTSPNTRGIVALRDPVAKTLSHFNRNRTKGREKLKFHEALAAEIGLIAAQADVLRTNSMASSDRFQHFPYRLRGEYAPQVAALMADFPRESVLAMELYIFFTNDAQESA